MSASAIEFQDVQKSFGLEFSLGPLTLTRWPLVAAGVGLCGSGYFILVYQLRAGIRPSSNEKLFSAG